MNAILEAEDLVKRYPGVTAVDGLSLALRAGSCFGMLGPNGAGKTTTVEMLEGVLQPTSGRIRFRGEALGPGFRARAGIQFQRTALQDYMTVHEALVMFARLYPRTASLEELIELCTLGGFLDRYCNRLSGGQRQRLLLAIALVPDPDILFLDEPTTGLDPQSRRNFWSLVESIRGRGKTILLTTHYMEEAARLCDEVAIVDHGRIIAQGAPSDLLARHFGDTVLELPREDIGDALGHVDGSVVDAGDRVEIFTRDVTAAIESLAANGATLERLRIRERTLEDLFLELTGRELRA
ncbi:MAG: ABC transporter ATP-binding protein [Halofilum sp. (in: g-proteobacteria)]|nr:ABC transporter ATP-binding protein [Halofilum sp. (in: g-proteobacteria)]